MRVTAFCPGHITGFFLPCEHENPMLTGSRGAGICIDRGVTTTVSSRPGSGRIDVLVDGVRGGGGVTATAVGLLLGNMDIDITVESFLDLPAIAGFGTSAAGALSASFALADILGLPAEDAFAAAHLAELRHHTAWETSLSPAEG